jgi:hypothetical protein
MDRRNPRGAWAIPRCASTTGLSAHLGVTTKRDELSAEDVADVARRNGGETRGVPGGRGIPAVPHADAAVVRSREEPCAGSVPGDGIHAPASKTSVWKLGTATCACRAQRRGHRESGREDCQRGAAHPSCSTSLSRRANRDRKASERQMSASMRVLFLSPVSRWRSSSHHIPSVCPRSKRGWRTHQDSCQEARAEPRGLPIRVSTRPCQTG